MGAPIPEDPTVNLRAEDAARVRAKLLAEVRAAGENWRPVIESYLKVCGVWRDPRDADREREEDERLVAEDMRLQAERRDDSRPATRGELREVVRALVALERRCSNGH